MLSLMKSLRYINSASYFIKGVKSAADFLMNLQYCKPNIKQHNRNAILKTLCII